MDHRQSINTCMYCFADTGGATKCPNCGGDANAPVPQDHLAPGTVLNETWLIGRAVGQDANGVVYVALDLRRHAKARIREYLPKDCAQRMPDGSIQVVPGEDERYETGLRSLRASAESAEDPEKRHPFFEANNTIYVVQLRKKRTAESADREEEPKPNALTKQILLFGSIIAVLVIGVMIIVSVAGRRATDTLRGDTLATIPPVATATIPPVTDPTPTAQPNIGTPTPDPYAVTTPGGLNWQQESGTGGNNIDDYYNSYQDIADKNATSSPTYPPTLAPTATPNTTAVNPESSEASIKALQWRLIELGWLDATTASGKYDTDTRYALAYFQKYIRDTFSAGVKANGYGDELTMRWLNDADAPVNPDRKATPAPTVSAAPSLQPGTTQRPTITADSSPATILALQERLAVLGWLDAQYATGAYNSQTKYAVAYFQQYLKNNIGLDVSATGYADHLTQLWMEGAEAPRPTQTPTQTPTQAPTQAPTQTPTQAPTQAPTAPATTPEAGPINDKSSPARILEMQNRLVALGWMEDPTDATGAYNQQTIIAVTAFQDKLVATYGAELFGDVEFEQGYADEVTQLYLNAQDALKPDPTHTPTQSPTQAPTVPPETQTTVYNYQINQYYFTAVDGVMNSTYDHKVAGVLMTTTEPNLTISVPSSAYEGYVYDASSQYNILTKSLTDPNATYTFQVVYIMNTTSPTPAPTLYSYEVREFYFTSVDGVMNKEYDYAETSGVLTTAESSLTVSAPASRYDGYVFSDGNQYNSLTLAFDDAARTYSFQAVYIKDTVSPEPEVTPEPQPTLYSYEVREFYFTSVDGVMNKEYDYAETSGVLTTTESSLTVSAPASRYDGYVFSDGNQYNSLTLAFDDAARTYSFQAVYIKDTVSPEPEVTPEPEPEITPEPEPEITAPPAPEQAVPDEQLAPLVGLYNTQYPDKKQADTKDQVVLWIQNTLKAYDQTQSSPMYFPTDYAPTGVYDAETMRAITALQQTSEDLMFILTPDQIGVVTNETFQLVAELYSLLNP